MRAVVAFAIAVLAEIASAGSATDDVLMLQIGRLPEADSQQDDLLTSVDEADSQQDDLLTSVDEADRQQDDLLTSDDEEDDIIDLCDITSTSTSTSTTSTSTSTTSTVAPMQTLGVAPGLAAVPPEVIHIVEETGAKKGKALTISLVWGGRNSKENNDLDLWVEHFKPGQGQADFTVNWKNTKALNGQVELDMDMITFPDDGVENIFMDIAPKGTYKVHVHYYEQHDNRIKTPYVVILQNGWCKGVEVDLGKGYNSVPPGTGTEVDNTAIKEWWFQYIFTVKVSEDCTK